MVEQSAVNRLVVGSSPTCRVCHWWAVRPKVIIPGMRRFGSSSMAESRRAGINRLVVSSSPNSQAPAALLSATLKRGLGAANITQ